MNYNLNITLFANTISCNPSVFTSKIMICTDKKGIFPKTSKLVDNQLVMQDFFQE